MAAPRLRLFLDGVLVTELPLLGAPIRIGRLKGNELVINNLSTSRFHATLTQSGGHFVLADLGSENGSWVNGRRVKECRVGPGDRIEIGKHEIMIVVDEREAPAAAEAPAPTLVIDAALEPLDTEGELAESEEPFEEALADDGGGTELFGDAPSAGLPGPDLGEFDVSELDLSEADAKAVPPESPTVLLDDTPGSTGAPHGESTPPDTMLRSAPRAPWPVTADSSGTAAPFTPGHAGLILQRAGRLERVIPWETDRITLGRAAECELVLATPEISRRHALLVRDGDRYEVRDLESINGTMVNGQKITRHPLRSGDVVRIEDFEITFVLDRAPIHASVKTEPPPPAAPGCGDPGLTQIGELLDLAPFVSEEAAEDDSGAMSFDTSVAPESAPIAELADLDADLDAPDGFEIGEALEVTPHPGEPVQGAAPESAEGETALLAVELDEEPDGEKDLVETPREVHVLRLELCIRVEALPPPLREALSALDPTELRLPVELRLATGDE